MKNIALFLFPVIFLLGACEKDDIWSSKCDQKAVVNEDQFQNAPADLVTIMEAEIKGDCLRIKFGAGGCSGDTWRIQLIGSEYLNESLLPLRDIRLSMENKEVCLAFLTKEMTFDIKDLRASEEKMILNIVNGDTSVLYEYLKPFRRMN